MLHSINVYAIAHYTDIFKLFLNYCGFEAEQNEVFALEGKNKSWKIVIYDSSSDRLDINLMLFS